MSGEKQLFIHKIWNIGIKKLKIFFSCDPVLGDILPVPGAIPLRFLLRVHVLPVLPIGPVLWLVLIHIPLPSAEQHRHLSRGRQGRQRRRLAPPAARTPALPPLRRVQRLLCLYSGIGEREKILSCKNCFIWLMQRKRFHAGPLLRMADKLKQERRLPVQQKGTVRRIHT